MKCKTFLLQLGDYFDVYLPDVRRASKNTIAAYADSFAVFFQFLYESKGMQHTSVSYKNLTPAVFDEFILWMKNEKGYSPTSVRQRMPQRRKVGIPILYSRRNGHTAFAPQCRQVSRRA